MREFHRGLHEVVLRRNGGKLQQSGEVSRGVSGEHFFPYVYCCNCGKAQETSLHSSSEDEVVYISISQHLQTCERTVPNQSVLLQMSYSASAHNPDLQRRVG